MLHSKGPLGSQSWSSSIAAQFLMQPSIGLSLELLLLNVFDILDNMLNKTLTDFQAISFLAGKTQDPEKKSTLWGKSRLIKPKES